MTLDNDDISIHIIKNNTDIRTFSNGNFFLNYNQKSKLYIYIDLTIQNVQRLTLREKIVIVLWSGATIGCVVQKLV